MRATPQAAVQKVATPLKPIVSKQAAAAAAGLGFTATRLLLFAVVGAASLLVFAYLATVLVPCWWEHRRVYRAQKEWKPMAQEYARLDSLRTQQAKDGMILDELDAQIAARLRWAKILNAVSDVVPASIQLVKLGTVMAKEMIAAPLESKPGDANAKKIDVSAPGKGPPPPPPMVEKQVQLLELEGVAVKGKLGEEDLQSLLDQIRSHPVFKEYFDNIRLMDVTSTTDQAKKFSIRCRFRLPGSSGA